jgi:3-methyladenine DNA glycosylase AlkD
MSLKNLMNEFEALKQPGRAKNLKHFFKTGPGEYGEGDVFLGIQVPVLRNLAKKYNFLNFDDLKKLLMSSIHEHRLTALLILVLCYQRSKILEQRQAIYQFYIEQMTRINNWDLVDLTAPYIVGHYLYDKDRTILKDWAKSKSLWVRRIAVVSTIYFIRKNEFKETLIIAKQLLKDSHDLIHKAVGWMLREVGKRDLNIEERFLKKHYRDMPRTMLRYAIEKFDEEKRKYYLVV